MVLHNIIEDIVLSKVVDIFSTIEKEGNTEKLCICKQCQVDTACYVLNRTTPFYIVSNRGAARIQLENVERQQKEADITALIYEGLKRVNHNHRPNIGIDSPLSVIPSDKPVYNIPNITGRLFDGMNFAPMSGVKMELYCNGILVDMKDRNWQNPLHLVSHTEGTYSFWPIPSIAEKIGDRSIFEFTLKVEKVDNRQDYETLTHVFSIPVISEIQTSKSFTLERTFKLPDLFMFPPGEGAYTRSLDE